MPSRVISIVIPTRNGRDDLRRCLDAIDSRRTDEEVEVVVLDSSSTDGTAELARARGAHVHTISPADFDHGATRNLGASLARGDVLVFTSQDAHAESPDWLTRLVAPLREDAAVAGVYGRQLPHDGATPPEVFFLDFLYGPTSRSQRAGSVDELTMETTLFSNANSAMRRSTWEEEPFVEDIIMSEDQEWSRRMLLSGATIRYEAGAAVRHSHRYTLGAAFRRFFDSGVSAERAYLAGERPAEDVLRRAALRYAREEAAWLWERHRAWLPYAAAYEAAKFAGLALGTRHHRLPAWMNRRCSALPAYWGRDSLPGG